MYFVQKLLSFKFLATKKINIVEQMKFSIIHLTTHKIYHHTTIIMFNNQLSTSSETVNTTSTTTAIAICHFAVFVRRAMCAL